MQYFRTRTLIVLARSLKGERREEPERLLYIHLNLVIDDWMDVNGEGEFSA